MKKILLVDANLLLFRSFYAAAAIIPNNPGNMPAHLFFNSFFELYKEEKPEYVFFAFDGVGPTWRHTEFDGYKAGRTKAPNELYQQKEIIRNILDTMKLKNVSKNGDEADDLIATFANKYKNEFDILILSEDRDLLQLVDDNISIIQKNRDKNIKGKYIKINSRNFFEKFGFKPKQTTDYKAIAGDKSDNLLGIKGIGPKTTLDLLNKYSDLDEIYSNLDKASEKIRNTFIEFKDQAYKCKKLATLNNNVDIDLNLDNLEINNSSFSSSEVLELLDKLNLKKIKEIIYKINNS